MYQNEIRLSQETVRQFVNAACQCDFHVDLCYNKITVNAKSLMGVFSLDLSNKLTVIYNEKDEAFECALNEFAVA